VGERSGLLLGINGLLSLRLRVSQGASVGDILLASVCTIEKVTLWEGRSETDEGVAKDEVLPSLAIWRAIAESFIV